MATSGKSRSASASRRKHSGRIDRPFDRALARRDPDLDPLHDEGVAYGEKLAQAGVPARHVDLAGMAHGFLHLHSILEEGKRALAEMSAMLRETWSR